MKGCGVYIEIPLISQRRDNFASEDRRVVLSREFYARAIEACMPPPSPSPTYSHPSKHVCRYVGDTRGTENVGESLT